MAARREDGAALRHGLPVWEGRPARCLPQRPCPEARVPIRVRPLVRNPAGELRRISPGVRGALDEGDGSASMVAASKAFGLIGTGSRERFCPVFVSLVTFRWLLSSIFPVRLRCDVMSGQRAMLAWSGCQIVCHSLHKHRNSVEGH